MSASWKDRVFTYESAFQCLRILGLLERTDLLFIAHDARTNDVESVLNNPLSNISVLHLSLGEGFDKFGQDEPADHKPDAVLVDNIVDKCMNVGGESGLIFAGDELVEERLVRSDLVLLTERRELGEFALHRARCEDA